MEKISCNIKDDNVIKIQKTLSKLDKYKLSYLYRVYGLKQEDNPQVLIEFSPALFDREKFNPISKFLVEKKNILSVQVNTINDAENKRVYIGLRRDLRNNVKTCIAIIETIIYFLENKLKMDVE